MFLWHYIAKGRPKFLFNISRVDLSLTDGVAFRVTFVFAVTDWLVLVCTQLSVGLTSVPSLFIMQSFSNFSYSSEGILANFWSNLLTLMELIYKKNINFFLLMIDNLISKHQKIMEIHFYSPMVMLFIVYYYSLTFYYYNIN